MATLMTLLKISADITGLEGGVTKAVGTIQKLEQSTTMADRAVGFLKSNFSQFTAANLASSAIQAVVGELERFVSVGLKLGPMEQSFFRLSQGVQQDSTAMLNAMAKGTKGMVSNFDLMQSANKAVLLGLPVTSQSMGELAKTATALGKAMGLDATQALNDLITALGRSSPLILDNLGLTVKVGEANEAYAEQLGKTVEEMTDAEKKMAFYEAAMEAARKKTEQLGDQTMTLGEIATSVWTSIGNVVSASASSINVGAGSALSSLRNIAATAFNAIRTGSLGMAIQIQAAGEQVKAQMASTSGQIQNDVSDVSNTLFNLGGVVIPPTKAAIRELDRATRDLIKSAEEWVLIDGELIRKSDRKKYVESLLTELPLLRAQLIANREEMLLHLPVIHDWAAANDATTATLLQMGASAATVSEATVVTHEQFVAATEKTASWRESLTGLSEAMTQLSQTASNSVVSALASMVNALNVSIQAVTSLREGFANLTSGKGLSGILNGLGGLVSGIGGLVSAAQAAIQIGKALFNVFDRDKGRDLVEDFAKEFGGFDGPNGLHALLLKLGDAGEQLWIKLTQGVGRNNADQARAVIDEVRRAIEGLNRTASEFPGITYHPGMETPEFGGEVPEFASGSGGIRDFGSGTLAMLHGREAVITESQLGGVGGGTTVIYNYVMLDGRQVGESVTEYQSTRLQQRKRMAAA